MTKKCKFDVEITYNSDYFSEGEIEDTIKNSIIELNEFKKIKFGQKIVCEPGKVNCGLVASVKKNNFEFIQDDSLEIIETLVSLSNAMDDSDEENAPELKQPQVEELLGEVRKAFK